MTEVVDNGIIAAQKRPDTENVQRHVSCHFTQKEASENKVLKLKTDSVDIANAKEKSGIKVKRLVKCTPLYNGKSTQIR